MRYEIKADPFVLVSDTLVRAPELAPAEFADGYTLFAFQLAPDAAGGACAVGDDCATGAHSLARVFNNELVSTDYTRSWRYGPSREVNPAVWTPDTVVYKFF